MLSRLKTEKQVNDVFLQKNSGHLTLGWILGTDEDVGENLDRWFIFGIGFEDLGCIGDFLVIA